MVDERNVPEGYKVTEAGVIPEDWGVKTFGEVFSFMRTGNNSRSDLNETGEINYIHYGDIHTKWNIHLDCNEEKIPYISFNKIKNLPTIENGDLIMADASEDYEGIGKSIEVRNVGNRKIVSGLHTFLLRGNREILVDGFKGYIQSISSVKNEMRKISTGISVYGISKEKVKSIQFPVPPSTEQKAIAEALYDTDNLIQSVEKLIDKKKKIKQGAMQQLLTGKKRLPGFSGEWEVRRLGEIGEFSGAGIDKKINADEEKVRLLNFLDVYHKDFIYSNDLWHEVTAPKYKAEKCSIKRGDVFFTPSSELRIDIALSAVAMEDIDDAVYSYHVIRYRFYDEWDIQFKTYIFNTRFFFSQAETMCEGSGKRYVISLKKFKELKIMYPTDLIEQKAIAQVLSDMDAEIEALEEKLEKYKTIKQGMMQELLTGRIRLI